MAVAARRRRRPGADRARPRPDFAKTPAQTVAVLRRLDALGALGRPLLLAVSRKDFLGAITGRGPRERGRGDARRVEFGVRAGASILRVHDVAAAADFLAVRAVLEGERELAPDEGLTPTATRALPFTRQVAGRCPNAAGCRPTHTEGNDSCLLCLTAPRSRSLRSPISTCSPTSSASTASAVCARTT